MSLEETLLGARADAQGGDLARARDRLLGLLSTFPASLEVRRELGDLYWRLGDPARAGCLWYLEEVVDERVAEALRAFEKRFGGDPGLMFRALKLRGPLLDPTHASLPPAASARLEALVAAARERGLIRPGRRRGESVAPGGWRRVVPQYGCMALLAAILVLAIVGLLTLLRGLDR